MAYELIFLDGVAEEPGDWMFGVDGTVLANLGKIIGTWDTVRLGRGTYDHWVGYAQGRRPAVRRLHAVDADVATGLTRSLMRAGVGRHGQAQLVFGATTSGRPRRSCPRASIRPACRSTGH